MSCPHHHLRFRDGATRIECDDCRRFWAVAPDRLAEEYANVGVMAPLDERRFPMAPPKPKPTTVPSGGEFRRDSKRRTP